MRLEVIDHRKTANPIGRAFYAEGEVELSYQDNGNTLKVFLRDTPDGIELTPIDPKILDEVRKIMTPDEEFWQEYSQDLKHYGV